MKVSRSGSGVFFKNSVSYLPDEDAAALARDLCTNLPLEHVLAVHAWAHRILELAGYFGPTETRETDAIELGPNESSPPCQHEWYRTTGLPGETPDRCKLCGAAGDASNGR